MSILAVSFVSFTNYDSLLLDVRYGSQTTLTLTHTTQLSRFRYDFKIVYIARARKRIRAYDEFALSAQSSSSFGSSFAAASITLSLWYVAGLPIFFAHILTLIIFFSGVHECERTRSVERTRRVSKLSSEIKRNEEKRREEEERNEKNIHIIH